MALSSVSPGTGGSAGGPVMGRLRVRSWHGATHQNLWATIQPVSDCSDRELLGAEHPSDEIERCGNVRVSVSVHAARWRTTAVPADAGRWLLTRLRMQRCGRHRQAQ